MKEKKSYTFEYDVTFLRLWKTVLITHVARVNEILLENRSSIRFSFLRLCDQTISEGSKKRASVDENIKVEKARGEGEKAT